MYKKTSIFFVSNKGQAKVLKIQKIAYNYKIFSTKCCLTVAEPTAGGVL